MTELCFHCGSDMPMGRKLTALIDGVAQPVCCIGCQSVSLMISGADMTVFYRQRTRYSPKAAETTPATAEWFNDSAWLSSFTQADDNGIRRIPLLVTGMSCAACSWLIEQFLLKVPGVIGVDIQLSLSRVVIRLAPETPPSEAIEQLQSLGYGIRPWRNDSRLKQLRAEVKSDIRRLGVAGIGMMQVGMFAIALHAGDLQGIDAELQQLLRLFSAPLTLFVLLYSGRTFFYNAWQHAKKGGLIMDSSVSLALILATGASLWATFKGGGETYYDSVTMFVFFLLLARFIEKRLRNTDLLALVRIEDALPEFVMVKKAQQWQRLPRQNIEVGDEIQVQAGDAIAFDGQVINGASAVEESVFTGESVPRPVTVGDHLYSGTVNAQSVLEMRVGSHYRDSRLAALQQDVDEARHAKPPYLKLIDQIAARFVAVIIIAAAITALIWLWVDPERALWSALAVLVVACPCALSLATPAALAAATAALRKRGIRVHGEFGLLAAADADWVLIDKTGTLTETSLAIDVIETSSECTTETALGLAAALQTFSQHPAARPFHTMDAEADIRDITSLPGRGMQGKWRGQTLRLGSRAFCEALADLPPPPDNSHYWLALVHNKQWLSWIGLAETLRPGAGEAIAQFKLAGTEVCILSGDNSARVADIARQLDVDFRANCQPSDKLVQLEQARRAGAKVMAIGDGLNDAPLLSAADVSIAVASATALTKAQADFVIAEGDLTALITIVSIAKRCRRIIRQNLYWAAGYNFIAIPFAAAGFVAPWLAAIGMSLSSLIVVLNALRLRRG